MEKRNLVPFISPWITVFTNTLDTAAPGCSVQKNKHCQAGSNEGCNRPHLICPWDKAHVLALRTFLGALLEHPPRTRPCAKLWSVSGTAVLRRFISSQRHREHLGTNEIASSEYISKLHIRLILYFYWQKATRKFQTNRLVVWIDSKTMHKMRCVPLRHAG